MNPMLSLLTQPSLGGRAENLTIPVDNAVSNG